MPSAVNERRVEDRDAVWGARPRVVIVGAGFAGLFAARELKRAPVDVLLIDQHNYHTFQPLLYQVATAQLEQDDVVRPVRAVFRNQDNVRFRHGTVTGVDWDTQTVLLASGDELPFDYLIVGAGAVYNDFGIPGVKDHAFFLKSLSGSVNLRSHILRRFELASRDPSAIERGALDFVIVGGGPTGVEMAGAMVELLDRVLPKDFPELDVSRSRVILLEMLDSVLPTFTERSQRHARAKLEQRGVEVRLKTAVKEVRSDSVLLDDGSEVPTQTLLWAAGVKAHPLTEALGVELGRGGRIAVEEDLSLPGKSFAFAAGDAAGGHADAKPWPQVAPVAIQQGKHAAKQVLRRLNREPSEPFGYVDRGMMAIIGRNSGVAELTKRLGGFRFRGFLGWLAWLFVHLMSLPGHQNKVNAFTNWVFNYLTFDRHARLITEMEPSPAEIADRTGKIIDAETPSRKAQQSVEEAKIRAPRPGEVVDARWRGSDERR